MKKIYIKLMLKLNIFTNKNISRWVREYLNSRTSNYDMVMDTRIFKNIPQIRKIIVIPLNVKG